ncbi:protein ALP1-like [Bufo gargarizans]|uniref:protein ALP1-like n=1 Tax=Bufo gargarizans TaxID=30331 RepID=UPI001CF13E15|nr:protein ALP1-like [Bufo gargarizans]XP_044155216.1 protein ALP1-like [Bufo gargarizans]
MFVLVLWWILWRRRLRRQEQARRRRHRVWMQRIRRHRDNRQRFAVFCTELRSDADKFYNYCHMSISAFDELLSRLRTSLILQNTVNGEYIGAEGRLIITLRFLATGEKFVSMHLQFHFRISTIASIVNTTCKVIWRDLQPVVMPTPTQETWLEVAAGFETATSFPNCIGAVDAQHVRVLQPLDSRSRYLGHKKYFSVLVLAVADTKCKFVAIDVGSYDRTGDCRVLDASQIQQRILQDQTSLPPPRPFPGTTDPVPLVMVSDYVFAVTPPLLCPYPWHGLDNRRRMFNCRLSCACQYVESTFGIMAGRWQVFCSTMQLDVSTAESVIRACCVIHNYVRDYDGEEADLNTQMPYIGVGIGWSYNRPLGNGLRIRDSFADYFVSPEGAVTWQFSCLGDSHADLH